MTNIGVMDLELFKEILQIDSTSGKERELAEFLASRLKTDNNTVERYEVGDGTLNLLFSWGNPKLFFCTHLDTVPPYIPPVFEDGKVMGRGSCDAKGQIFSMFTACRQLEKEGIKDFALLLLAGEETGSFGAKAYTRDCPGGELVVVGEPTDNYMVSSAKGTRSFQVKIKGKSCHSGYPERGISAVERFVDFVNKLRTAEFKDDNILGKTTYNIGKLISENPQNVLSPEVSFRIYFRTTFESHDSVIAFMNRMKNEYTEIEDFGGDTPMHFTTFEGIPQKPVAFGSDAPQLHKFTHKSLCGPGSIFTAHTDGEYVLIADIEKAVRQYIAIAKQVLTR